MKHTKNKTLLEQVLEVKRSNKSWGRTIDTDVAIAWIKDEITITQIGKTLWPDRKYGSTTTMVYLFLNRSLREAYRQGRIKVVE